LPDPRSSDSGIWPATFGRARAFAAIPWRAQVVSVGYITVDFLAVVISHLLAAWLYNSVLFAGIRLRAGFDPVDFLLMGLALGVFLVLVFGALGLYRRGSSVLNVEEDMLLLRGFAFCAIVALALSFVMRDRQLPRITICLALMMMVPLVVIGRRFVRRTSSWLLAAGVGSQPVIIYGAGDTGRQLADRLIHNPQFGLVPVGFIDDGATGEDGQVYFGGGRKRSLELIANGDKLVYTLKTRGVSVLFLAMPKISSDRLADIQEKCRESEIYCYHVPLFAAGPLRKFSITFVGDMPLVYERAPSFGVLNRTAKRAFDLIVAAILLVSFGWLFAGIALAIRVWSRGPVFFAQERIGQHGLAFRMFKFRSMHTDAPAYATKPESGSDPRVFTFGRLLRRTSLDELPQLWNVLKGEMSLVGPRPEMPQIAAEYNAVQRERFMVRPGMTGLWQVSADRNLPIHENVDYDLYYIYNQSFLLDMIILGRTVFAMFGGH
jgi:exopolysaccharide biosynthesis polyprenyl glycosylphosphotransferase